MKDKKFEIQTTLLPTHSETALGAMKGRAHCEAHHFYPEWGKPRRDPLRPRSQAERKWSHRAWFSGVAVQHRSDRRPRKQLSRPECLESTTLEVCSKLVHLPLRKTHLAMTFTKFSRIFSLSTAHARKGHAAGRDSNRETLKDSLERRRQSNGRGRWKSSRRRFWQQLPHPAGSLYSGRSRGFLPTGPLQRSCFRTDTCVGFAGCERLRRVKAGL